MKLTMGIVGLPNVGKSTLFNALTEKSVPADNYPFCTIDPSVGIVAVPDPRVQVLGELSSSKKNIPAVVEFVDIAGLIRGASEGEGLGNEFLSTIREVAAIAHVVRIFEDGDVTHVDDIIDPVRDIDTINTELALADLQVIDKRLSGNERDVKRGDKAAILRMVLLEKCREALETKGHVRNLDLSETEEEEIMLLNLLSRKPMLYVLNKKAGAKNLDTENEEGWVRLRSYLDSHSCLWVVVDARVEAELSQIDPSERALFRLELGVKDSGINDLIVQSYALLGLMTFLTTGEVETRAWTVKRGSTAPEAGAAIHTDFRERFIRAEVVAYNDLVSAGSYPRARDEGKVRTEGKDYIVQDGDVIEFKL